MQWKRAKFLAVVAVGVMLGRESSKAPVNTNTTPGPRPMGPQSMGPAAIAEPLAQVEGQYADVNGLKMYYEVYGNNNEPNKPLVILHGAFGVAVAFPELARGRQLIVPEMQGHGHTADIDRPLSVEQMADDTAALLQHLKIDQADFFGYSMGGNVALAIAIRHPHLVRKLAINGSNHGSIEEAYDAESLKQFRTMPEDFAPGLLKAPYDKVAPDPSRWPVLVSKIKTMGLESKGFNDEQLRAIKGPVLITLGDRDVVRVEHAVELYRLIRNSQLAVFPGGDHFMIWTNPDKLLPTIAAFFDAPLHGGPPMRPKPVE